MAGGAGALGLGLKQIAQLHVNLDGVAARARAVPEMCPRGERLVEEHGRLSVRATRGGLRGGGAQEFSALSQTNPSR